MFSLILLLSVFSFSGVESGRVVMLGIDGLGELYLENATSFLPNFKKVRDEGMIATYPNYARNRIPTVSAPNWNSIITSQPPELSGVVNNDWVLGQNNSNPASANIPNIFGDNYSIPIWEVIKSQNQTIRTSVVISWMWIQNLVKNSTVDHFFPGEENDLAVEGEVIRVLKKNLTDFVFIHLDWVDSFGHEFGWGSPPQYAMITEKDMFLGKLLSVLREGDILFITGDHGGWRKSHDFTIQATLYVPCIFYSPGRIKSGIIKEPVSNIDFSPTILNLMGLKRGDKMFGKVLKL